MKEDRPAGDTEEGVDRITASLCHCQQLVHHTNSALSFQSHHKRPKNKKKSLFFELFRFFNYQIATLHLMAYYFKVKSLQVPLEAIKPFSFYLDNN